MKHNLSIELDCDIQVVAYFLRELEQRGVLPAFHFKHWNPTVKFKKFIWINTWTNFISPHYTGDFYLFSDNDSGTKSIKLSELVSKENNLELSFEWEKLME